MRRSRGCCVRGYSKLCGWIAYTLGSLATIGRRAAVANFGFIRIWGAPAWWLWGAIHVYFLVGVRNRVSVVLDWFWSYLTFSGGTRLITGSDVLAPRAAGDS